MAKENFFNIHLAYWIERVMRELFHLRSICLSFQLSDFFQLCNKVS